MVLPITAKLFISWAWSASSLYVIWPPLLPLPSWTLFLSLNYFLMLRSHHSSKTFVLLPGMLLPGSSGLDVFQHEGHMQKVTSSDHPPFTPYQPVSYFLHGVVILSEIISFIPKSVCSLPDFPQKIRWDHFPPKPQCPEYHLTHSTWTT